MLTLNHRLRAREEEVAAKVIDSEAIMINLANGIYYSMDKIGGWIWEMIEKRHSLEEMITATIARYDVSREQAQADVERLAAELIQEKLVVVVDGEAPDSEAKPEKLEQRLPYEPPQLNIYRDMGDLLALDPPTPGFMDIAWKDPEDESSR